MFPKLSSSNESILVLIDTSHDNHLAFNRALAVAGGNSKLSLHLFFCVNDGDYQSQTKVDEVLHTIKLENIKHTKEYCDIRYKYEGVMECAKRISPSLLLVPDYDLNLKVRDMPSTTRVFRKAQHCPVMILRSGNHIYSEYGLSTERMMISSAA